MEGLWKPELLIDDSLLNNETWKDREILFHHSFEELYNTYPLEHLYFNSTPDNKEPEDLKKYARKYINEIKDRSSKYRTNQVFDMIGSDFTLF